MKAISAELEMIFNEQIPDTFRNDKTEAITPPCLAAPPIWKELVTLGIKIAIISCVFFLLFTLVYGIHQNLDIDAAPTVKAGDLVMFYRLDKEYSIGDLVLLNFQGERQVRRVVAKAGDTVDITEDGLVVNGAVQQEPGIFEETWAYENGPSFPLTVGEHQVFVLGDARANATDSRVYGPVDKEDTLGSVVTIIKRRNL